MNDVGLVVPAAGRGDRFGPGDEKALVLLRGKPMLTWALLAFEEFPAIVERVVAAPPGREDAFRDRALRPFGLADRVRVVAGGLARQDSVAAGLRALSSKVSWVLVHDAARPLVGPGLIRRVLEARDRGNVVPGLPPRDSVARLDAEGVTGYETRERLLLIQTPQGFERAGLERALERASAEGVTGTDEGSLAIRAGARVGFVEGDRENLKITYPEDVSLAEAVLAARESRT